MDANTSNPEGAEARRVLPAADVEAFTYGSTLADQQSMRLDLGTRLRVHQ